jgi:acyl transferase domain-containing protein
MSADQSVPHATSAHHLSWLLQAGRMKYMSRKSATTVGQLLNGISWAGEITSGYADGGFTLEQTVCVAYERAAKALQYTSGGGLMASVGLSVEAADARLVKAGLSSVVVACDNSPSNVTLSGETP